MAYAMVFKQGFLDRCRRMSGLQTDAAFARSIGVSKEVMSKAKRTNLVTPSMLVGLYEAYGFQPGEVVEMTEIPGKTAAEVTEEYNSELETTA